MKEYFDEEEEEKDNEIKDDEAGGGGGETNEREEHQDACCCMPQHRRIWHIAPPPMNHATNASSSGFKARRTFRACRLHMCPDGTFIAWKSSPLSRKAATDAALCATTWSQTTSTNELCDKCII